MNQHKGFSLTEVLISLMLVTTMALALLQQQQQSRHLLNQLLLDRQDSQNLSHIKETELAQSLADSFLHSDWDKSKKNQHP